MSFGSGFAIYFIIWWLSLLVVIPFGARTQGETGEVAPGTISSAPVKPLIWQRLVAATILACVMFTVFHFVWSNDLVSLDDFPMFDPPSAR